MSFWSLKQDITWFFLYSRINDSIWTISLLTLIHYLSKLPVLVQTARNYSKVHLYRLQIKRKMPVEPQWQMGVDWKLLNLILCFLMTKYGSPLQKLLSSVLRSVLLGAKCSHPVVTEKKSHRNNNKIKLLQSFKQYIYTRLTDMTLFLTRFILLAFLIDNDC